MDIVTIQFRLSDIFSRLRLFQNDIDTVPEEALLCLRDFLDDKLESFHVALVTPSRKEGLESNVMDIYRLLTSFCRWYSENMLSHSPLTSIVKDIYERAQILWITPIERQFKNICPSDIHAEESTDEEDPMGFNARYGKAGESYRSLYYDLQEVSRFPSITIDMIYGRMKDLASRNSSSGVLARDIVNAAMTMGFLRRRPQRNAIIRELGLTCGATALDGIMKNPSENPPNENGIKRIMLQLVEH